MASEISKGDKECEIMERSLALSSLEYDSTTIEKRLPPEPDLICLHRSEGFVAFELVEMCDRTIAKSQAKLDEGYTRTSDPSERLVSQKLNKKYESNYPVELLCFTSGRIATPESQIVLLIKQLLCWASQFPFRRVWLMGSKKVYLVWDQSRSIEGA